MDLKQDLSDFVKSHPKNYIRIIRSQNPRHRKNTPDNTNLLTEIIRQTPLLNDQDHTLKTRIYWILNDLSAFPLCHGCGKPMVHSNVKSLTRGYSNYCCRKCQYLDRNWLERVKNGVKNRYGTDNYYKTDEFKAFSARNKDLIQQKRDETKRRNHTFNISNAEDEAFSLLTDYFPQESIHRQQSDPRYPFNCDFYIDFLDLFIEYNGSWTHNDHFYDENSPKDGETLEVWKLKSKTSKFYQNAIETWTVRDVSKLKTARKNGLNYLVFFKLAEIEDYFSQCGK